MFLQKKLIADTRTEAMGHGQYFGRSILKLFSRGQGSAKELRHIMQAKQFILQAKDLAGRAIFKQHSNSTDKQINNLLRKAAHLLMKSSKAEGFTEEGREVLISLFLIRQDLKALIKYIISFKDEPLVMANLIWTVLDEYIRRQELKEAQSTLELLAEKCGRDPFIRAFLIKIHLLQDDIAAAADISNEILAEHGHNFLVGYFTADIYYLLGQAKLACRCFNTAMRYFEYKDRNKDRSSWELFERMSQGMLPIYERALKLYPDDPELHYDLFVFFFLNNDAVQAKWYLDTYNYLTGQAGTEDKGPEELN